MNALCAMCKKENRIQWNSYLDISPSHTIFWALMLSFLQRSWATFLVGRKEMPFHSFLMNEFFMTQKMVLCAITYVPVTPDRVYTFQLLSHWLNHLVIRWNFHHLDEPQSIHLDKCIYFIYAFGFIKLRQEDDTGKTLSWNLYMNALWPYVRS